MQSPKHLTLLAALLTFITFPANAAIVVDEAEFLATAKANGDNCALMYDGFTDSDDDGIPDVLEGIEDADNDGLPNSQDRDSDNDGIGDMHEYGILRTFYTNPTYDPFYVHADADADGVNDLMDMDANDATIACIATIIQPDDLDFNGVWDFLDANDAVYTQATDPCAPGSGGFDSDRDYIPDYIETDIDTDGDGLPNYLDTDSDADDLPDRIESGLVWSETIPDFDGDGLPTGIETHHLDATILCLKFPHQPVDRNYSGVADYVEPSTGPEIESDAVCANGGYFDADFDGIPDVIEGAGDIDGDGIPNYIDLDSDGDTLPDTSEVYRNFSIATGTDDDLDGFVVGRDTNDNDANEACWAEIPYMTDHDNDGLYDFQDDDLDGDGVPDAEEIAYGGVYTTDTDDDGLTDAEEKALGSNPQSQDSDGGGTLDHWESTHGGNLSDPTDDQTITQDLDQDDDGIPDVFEQTVGSTVDHDGDFIPDTWEAGFVAEDSDGDGVIDDLTDANDNGLADVAEGMVTPPDFDNDGIPDFRDPDSDQDGLHDLWEMGREVYSLYSSNIFLLDSDNDGAPNHLDLDSDNDGVFDFDELGVLSLGRYNPAYKPRCGDSYSNSSNEIHTYEFTQETLLDANADGRVDWMQDNNFNGVADLVDSFLYLDENDTDGDLIFDHADIDHAIRWDRPICDWGIGYDFVETLQQKAKVDTDGDGIEDSYDPDVQNDGALDGTADFNTDSLPDLDGDGIPGVFDADEQPGWQPPVEVDADAETEDVENTEENESGEGEGNTDSSTESNGGDPLDPTVDPTITQDLDTDNDGIPDALEHLVGSTKDHDGDTIPDTWEAGFINEDSNGDGVIDDLTDANNNGLPDITEGRGELPDFDNDGIPDFRDADSDQDGLYDRYELGPDAFTDNLSAPALTDSDNDGAPNHLDLDSDNDGVFDFNELGTLSGAKYNDRYGITCGNGNSSNDEREFIYETLLDADQDGRVDWMQDTNGNGVLDIVDQTLQPDKTDTDGDLIFNQADIDHANRLNRPNCALTGDYYNPYSFVSYNFKDSVDTDGDGIEDSYDPDNDNNGALDGTAGVNLSSLPDLDGDGIAGVFDADEQPALTEMGNAENNASGSGDADGTGAEGESTGEGDSGNSQTVNVGETENADNVENIPQAVGEPAPDTAEANPATSTGNSGGGGASGWLMLLLLSIFASVPARRLLFESRRTDSRYEEIR